MIEETVHLQGQNQQDQMITVRPIETQQPFSGEKNSDTDTRREINSSNKAAQGTFETYMLFLWKK